MSIVVIVEHHAAGSSARWPTPMVARQPRGGMWRGRAQHMSAEMSYHWGQLDAAEALKGIY